MPKFNFRMSTLLKLREAARDERRAQLAQAFRADALLEQEQKRVEGELAAMQDELRRASGPGAVNVDRILDAQRFELALKAQKGQLAQQREQVGAEIERRRQALVEADREVRVLENLRERQRDRWREEESLRDIKRLDEVAQKREVEEACG